MTVEMQHTLEREMMDARLIEDPARRRDWHEVTEAEAESEAEAEAEAMIADARRRAEAAAEEQGRNQA